MIAELIKDMETLENILKSYTLDKESAEYWNDLICDINESKENGEWTETDWETLVTTYILYDEFGTKLGIASFSKNTESHTFFKNKSYILIDHFTFFSQEFYDTYTKDFIDMLKKLYPTEHEIRFVYWTSDFLTPSALIKAGFTEKKGKCYGEKATISFLKF